MAQNQITIFRKDTGVEVTADTVTLPVNPEWVRRSQRGVYNEIETTLTETMVVAKPFAKTITFTFNGQALSAANRARLYNLFHYQADTGLGTSFLRDECFGLQTSQLSFNSRTGVGSTFSEGGKTRQFYEIPIILLPDGELEIDDNPRTTTSGIVYWQGGFIAKELV